MKKRELKIYLEYAQFSFWVLLIVGGALYGIVI